MSSAIVTRADAVVLHTEKQHRTVSDVAHALQKHHVSTSAIALRVRERAKSAAARQRHTLYFDVAACGVAIETKVESAAFSRDSCLPVHRHPDEGSNASRRECLGHYCIRANRIHADKLTVS